jgi:hypothetical protein
MLIDARSLILTAVAATMVSACGSVDDSPGPGGMTAGENERLEQAAERLDARAPSPAQQSAATLEAEVAVGISREGQSSR